MSTAAPTSHRHRRRFAPLLVLVGLAASLALAASTTGVLSAFTASINNTTNNVGSGTLLMTETSGANTCLSTAGATISTNAGTCATINKFSGVANALPGVVQTTSVTIQNNGTAAAATFTLTPTACTAAANGAAPNGTNTAGFCGKVDVTLFNSTTGNCIVPAGTGVCPAPAATNTLASLGTTVINLPAPLAAGASHTYVFSVMIDNSATNADQGLIASKGLTWAFST